MSAPAPHTTLARERAIARSLRLIEARFGPDVVRRLGAARPGRARPVVPSGSLALDRATGIGGLPRGGVTEVCGPESSGKTTLLYAALAATQRAGGLAALVDTEGSADAAALVGCGVALADLLLVRPASAPDALLLLAILARCGGLDILGLSAVAALRDLPPGGVHGSFHGDLAAPDAARLLARGLRVLTVALAASPTAVVLTNDLLPPFADGLSAGGRALRHHALLRIGVEPLARLPDAAGGTRGLRVALTVLKSKAGAPGGRAAVDLLLGTGLDWPGELLRLGLATGVVAREPTGLCFGATALGRHEEAARRLLAGEATLAAALRAAVVAALSSPEAA
jgi:recombination protein RecA